MSDRVLITGGNGFLGSHLARTLRQAGRPVRLLVRPTSDLWRLENLDAEMAVGDVLLPGTLPEVMAGVGVVYHLAGLLGGAPLPDAAYRDLHINGTLNVLVTAQAAGVKRFVHVSSPGVLGPIQGPPADERQPHAPSNIYEATKSQGEKLALNFAQRTGLSLVVVRPEFVYGPGDTHVLGLFRAIRNGRFFFIGSGESQVHPTFVDDAVRGMMLVEAAGQNGRIYHVAGPEPVTVHRLATAVAGALGVPPPRRRVPRWLAWIGAGVLEMAALFLPFRPPLTRSGVNFFTETRAFSTARAQAELGYEAQVSLDEGVRRTVVWYQERGLL
ncbi:MAG: NAD-dependent epimerase/dehydratase family protein [Chloroflexota bacterium]